MSRPNIFDITQSRETKIWFLTLSCMALSMLCKAQSIVSHD